MSESKKIINLILRHSDINITTTTQAVSNAVGGWSNYKTTSWFNLNMEALLGDSFNKCDLYMLRLNQIAYTASSYQTTASDTMQIISLSGLNWVNSSYNVASANNTSKAIIAMAQILNNNIGTVNFNQNTCCIFFRKPEKNVTLQIDLTRLVDNATIVVSNALPQYGFSFDIVPITQ